MLLIDANMTVREVKEKIDEWLIPILAFCKQWNVEVHYENGRIVTGEVVEKIDQLITLLIDYKEEQLDEPLTKLHQLKLDITLFSNSINGMDAIERALIYHGIFTDQSQAELTEDAEILDLLELKRVSQTKISDLYQKACLRLLEQMLYHRIKQNVCKVNA